MIPFETVAECYNKCTTFDSYRDTPTFKYVSDNTASSPKPVAMMHDGITSYQPILLVCH